MDELYFPMYSYTVFKPNDLQFEKPESRGDISRYDYFDLTKMSKEDKIDFLLEMNDLYYHSEGHDHYDYQDYILYRYYFKQFVIRETTDNGNQTRYVKYTISDWNPDSKHESLDDRNLRVNIYTEDNNTGRFVRDLCYVIKVGHRIELMDHLDKVLAHFDDNKPGLPNLNILPIYFTMDSIRVGSTNFVRINALNKWSVKTEINTVELITQSLYRFTYLNYWILSKVENNESLDFVDESGINHTDIVTYVKKHATADKRVKIDMGKNAFIKIKSSNRNIYSHSNHIVRTLLDYRVQVVAHYQGYWCGSRRDGTLHLEQRWKESYEKNKTAPYRLIKERENVEAM